MDSFSDTQSSFHQPIYQRTTIDRGHSLGSVQDQIYLWINPIVQQSPWQSSIRLGSVQPRIHLQNVHDVVISLVGRPEDSLRFALDPQLTTHLDIPQAEALGQLPSGYHHLQIEFRDKVGTTLQTRYQSITIQN